MKKMKRIMLILLSFILLCSSVMAVNAKTYYTGKSVKWSNDKVQIVSIKGNKVTYRKIQYVDKQEYVDMVLGKKKTAKLTSNTKYYFGDADRLMKLQVKSGYKKNHYNLKWIYRVNKSTFNKQIKKSKSKWDQIQIKNGKVVRIFTKMQIAG